MQSDEKARELIREALRNSVAITTEELLSISEPARQELKWLLTKKRVETKSVVFVIDEKELTAKDVEEDFIYGEQLPSISYEVQSTETKGILKGALVIGDPVMQYLGTLLPGEKPKRVIVAKESHGLRSVYLLINSVGEVESLLDGGSQILSMARRVAEDLDITWDPDITVHMQSANGSLEQTLGLAKYYSVFTSTYYGGTSIYVGSYLADRLM